MRDLGICRPLRTRLTGVWTRLIHSLPVHTCQFILGPILYVAAGGSASFSSFILKDFDVTLWPTFMRGAVPTTRCTTMLSSPVRSSTTTMVTAVCTSACPAPAVPWLTPAVRAATTMAVLRWGPRLLTPARQVVRVPSLATGASPIQS